MSTLKEIMHLNENFEKMVSVAPNCRYDEGQALQAHYIDCVRQWLKLNKDKNATQLLRLLVPKKKICAWCGSATDEKMSANRNPVCSRCFTKSMFEEPKIVRENKSKVK